jgi:hypothetical protein
VISLWSLHPYAASDEIVITFIIPETAMTKRFPFRSRAEEKHSVEVFQSSEFASVAEGEGFICS